MLHWAFREMILTWHQLAAGIAAVASSFVLVLFFGAVFTGESEQIVALIERTEADVWVMQKGVGNMHMTMSFVADWKVDAVADVQGVSKVTPILYLNSVIEAGGRNWFSFVVGVEQGDARAGPWVAAGGAQLPGLGEAIVPDVFAADAGLVIGDTIKVGGRDFAVAGFSGDTFSMANSVTFVTMTDLADIMSSVGSVSYMLVDAEPGTDPVVLADRIRAEVENVNALPTAAFIARDFSIAVQMGLEIVWIMTLIGAALAVLLTSFVVYSHITDREREIAMMKALGVRDRAIYGTMLMQALVIGLGAFVIAAGLIYVAIPITDALLPKVSLGLTAGGLIRTGAVAIVTSLIAGAIPIRRVLSVDPVSAFQQ